MGPAELKVACSRDSATYGCKFPTCKDLQLLGSKGPGVKLLSSAVAAAAAASAVAMQLQVSFLPAWLWLAKGARWCQPAGLRRI